MTRGFGVTKTFVALACLVGGAAFANGNGPATLSLSAAGLTCGNAACHTSVTAPSLEIAGPALTSNVAADFTITLAGAPGVNGGILIEAKNATLTAKTNLAPAGTAGTALSHPAAGAVAFTGGALSFAFSVLPSGAGPVEIKAQAVSGNNDKAAGGDEVVTKTQEFAVTPGTGGPGPVDPPPSVPGGPTDAGVPGVVPIGSDVEGYLGCSAVGGSPLFLGALVALLARSRRRSGR